MRFLDKMERKYGRYAIRNLTAIVIGLYVAGYILEYAVPQAAPWLWLEPYFIIRRHQFWRLVSWLLIPPEGLSIFTIIMLFFYFSIGTSLEKTWGAFRYNVYIFSGLIFTILGAFVLYGILTLQGYEPIVSNAGAVVQMVNYNNGYIIGRYFSTYYINMSIFLAFAAAYPDMQVLLYFIIPIRIRYLGYLYAILLAVNFYQTSWPGRAAILLSLLNFIIFFFMTRNFKHYSPKEVKRRSDFRKATSGTARRGSARRRAEERWGTGGQRNASSGQAVSGGKRVPLHRCTVCGRTELDDPNLEFRYCTKCYGEHEYCQDHLFNHKHIQGPSDYDPQ